MGLCDCISSQESQNTYTATPTQTILVCLEKGVSPTSSAAPTFCGTLHSSCQEEPVPFHDLAELILRLDTLCKPAENPQSHARISGTSAAITTLPGSLSPYAGIFTISVEHRDHATLQGKLRGGLTGGRYLPFRSALDLMRLLTELTESGKEGSTHGI